MSDPGEAENDGSGTVAGAKPPDLPPFTSEHSPATQDQLIYEPLYPEITSKDAITIVVPPVQRPWEYQVYRETPFISKILEEYDDIDGVQFLVRLSDGSDSKVSLNLSTRKNFARRNIKVSC